MVDEEMGKVKTSVIYKILSQKRWGKGLKNRSKKTIDEIINWQLDWDDLMDKLSALDKESEPYKSDLSKIGNKITYAQIADMAGVDRIINMNQDAFKDTYGVKTRRQILKKVAGHKKDIDLGTFKNSKGDKVELILNKEQIIQKVMQLDDPILEDTFEKGMLYTEEIENALYNALNPEDLQYMENIRKVYDDIHKRVSPIFGDLYGIDFPYLRNYSGRAEREGIETPDMDASSILVDNRASYAAATNPSLKVRTQSHRALKYNEATPSLLKYAIQMEHYIAFAKPLQEVRAVFCDERVKAVIHQYYGENIYNKIIGFLNDIARDGVNRTKVIAPLDSIKFNFAQSVLKKPLKEVIMIRKIWKDLFNLSEAEGLSIASKEDIEQIIDMFIVDKIDPQVFLSNLEVLLRGGMPPIESIEDILGVGEREDYKPTESVSHFIFAGDRPSGALWFIAAYPDVMFWLNNKMRRHIKSHNRDYDGWEIKVAKLLGIDVESKNVDENQIINSNGEPRPKYLKNLVKHYKDTTGKKLETQVKRAEDDIYLGAEMLNAFGTENNFTLIAENTTKYYLELSRNYSGRFNDEYSLLATAGILDAQFYIFKQKIINPLEILSIAKKSLETGEESLINFIINLEVILFKIDTPDIDFDNIKDTCEGQRQNIKKAIQKVKDEYTSEPRFASEVTAFMNSTTFKPYRKMLRIKNKFLFF